MRKIISILVALSMLCTMLAMPAMAASTVSKTYISNATGAGSNNHTAATTVTGVKGRTAGDTSTYVTRVRPQSEIDKGNTSNHKFQYTASTGTADAGYGDLLIFSMSFISNSGMRDVCLTGNGGVNISTVFPLSDERVVDGWNKLVYVYDHSTAGDELNEYAGSWAMYLNGECINALGENRDLMDADNPFNYTSKGKMDQMRVMFASSAVNEEISMYFDDVDCYTVTTDDKAAYIASFAKDKPVLAESSDAKYTISEGVVDAAAGATAGDIEAADGTTVRVYQNKQYSQVLADTAVLKSGNIVVVEKDGIFNYYPVIAADGSVTLYEAYQAADISTFYRGEKSDAAGMGGKTTDDSSILLNSNVIEHDNQTHYNGFFSYAPGSISNGVWSGIDTSGYLVAEGEIFPASIRTIGIATNGGTTVADIPAVANEWNKFYVVYDFTNKKMKVVVDGVVTTDWAETVYGTANRNDIRFLITGNDNEAPAQVYLDDYRIYTIKSEPDYDAPAVLDTSKYTIDSGYLVASADDTVKDITSDDAEVRVYTDSTYTNLCSDSDVLLNGNVVVLVSGNGCFAYYPVTSALTRVPATVVTEHCDENNLASVTAARASITIADGFGGKAVSDKVAKLTGTTSTGDCDYFIQTTTVPADKDIVASILVYPEEKITSYWFATSGHSPVTDKIAATDLKTGEWNRITIVYDAQTKTSYTYINDVLKAEYSGNGISNGILRFIENNSLTAAEIANVSSYFDDFVIWTGDIAVPAVDFGKYTNDGWEINGFGDDTAAEALTEITPAEGYEDYTVTICDSEGNPAASDDKIEQGWTVTVYDGDVCLATYSFAAAEYEVSDIMALVTDGYDPANGKFGAGTLELSWDVNVYSGTKDIYGVIAHFDESGNLSGVAMEKNSVTGEGAVNATLEVKESEGTVKCMLWDAASLAPMTGTKEYSAYSSTVIEDAVPLYEGFTTKSAVFNYDDGIASDKQLVEILDKYQAKATFNLVSGRLYDNMKSAAVKAGYGETKEEVYAYAKAMYAGAYGNHEIANHTVTHRPASLDPGEESKDSYGNVLVGVSTEEEIADIQNCPIQLREWFGLSDDEAIGLAWPNGNAHNRSDYYTDLEPAMKEIGLKYARHDATGTFELPDDWYSWHATAHHPNAAPYVKQFIALPNSGDMKCLFIWGHTYEFNDAGNNDNLNWNYIEGIISSLADQGNIWFATNGDVYRYVEATKLVDVTDTTVANKSDMTVYYNINGKNIELAPGESYTIAEAK
ncbi:MAG: polysaccharide deacetylase family protein [Clostridia bacterium]|nr:polysaccharide deacetylase family protein [Clostridia bacterium]